ncbi:helix-turn-helix transcriptional regulator [Azonexus hydrophilus]|uniref:helix-turn-helix transcriptional regulator n=1 Tax=Azonexus hydrophilus TaxID=418702 RepID=UPI0009DD8DF3|nr:hypothetical protein [Azonexus hydrophilus]
MAQKTVPPTLAAFDSLPDSALIDVKVVSGVFGCSENTAWRRYGSLAIKVSPQQTRWRVADVRKALAALGNSGRAAA